MNALVARDLDFYPTLPFLGIVFRRRRVVLDPTDLLADVGDPHGLMPNQREQRKGQSRADGRQVDTLQAISVRSQGGGYLLARSGLKRAM